VKFPKQIHLAEESRRGADRLFIVQDLDQLPDGEKIAVYELSEVAVLRKTLELESQAKRGVKKKKK